MTERISPPQCELDGACTERSLQMEYTYRSLSLRSSPCAEMGPRHGRIGPMRVKGVWRAYCCALMTLLLHSHVRSIWSTNSAARIRLVVLELRVSASTQESHIDIHLPELRMKAYVIHSLFSPSVYLSMECKNTISFSSNHTLISYASPDNTFYSAHRSPLTASVIKQRGMGDTTIYVYPSATTPVCKVHRSHPRHPRTIACHHLASFAQCQPQANPREPRRNLS